MGIYKANFDSIVLKALNTDSVKLTSTIVDDIDVLAMSKERVKYNNNQFFILEFFVNILEGTKPINEDDAKRFCEIIIRENPYTMKRENSPNVLFAETDKTSSTITLAYYNPETTQITVNSDYFISKLNKYLQLKNEDNLTKKEKCLKRVEFLNEFLQTIGHEYTHFLQYEHVKNGATSFILDSLKNITFQGDYLYIQDKKDLYSAFKHLSSQKQKNLKALFKSQSFLNELRFMGYASYPYEKDADIGGYVFADVLLQKMIESVQKVVPIDSFFDKSLLSTDSLGDLMDIINKNSPNSVEKESVVKIIQSFDIDKLESIAETLSTLYAAKGSTKALDLKEITKLRQFKKLKSMRYSAFDNFAEGCNLLSKVGTICLNLFCVYGQPEQISDFYFKLVERGNPYALHVRHYYLQHHNRYNTSIGDNVEEERKLFDRKRVIELLTSDKVDMTAFSNFNWLKQSNFFDDEEKNELLCKLIEQKKFDYLTFLLSDNMDKIKFKDVKEAIERAAIEFNDNIEHKNSAILLGDYGNIYHALKCFDDPIEDKLILQLEENKPNLQALKKETDENQQKELYYSRYGKKAGDYYFNIWCGQKPNEEEKFKKTIETIEMIM